MKSKSGWHEPDKIVLSEHKQDDVETSVNGCRNPQTTVLHQDTQWEEAEILLRALKILVDYASGNKKAVKKLHKKLGKMIKMFD